VPEHGPCSTSHGGRPLHVPVRSVRKSGHDPRDDKSVCPFGRDSGRQEPSPPNAKKRQIDAANLILDDSPRGRGAVRLGPVGSNELEARERGQELCLAVILSCRALLRGALRLARLEVGVALRGSFTPTNSLFGPDDSRFRTILVACK